MTRLDHILWAVPDVDDAAARFAALAGVEPGQGGRHDGNGTRNALAGLGDDLYFEVIGPDRSQALEGTLGARFADLPNDRLYTFAVATDSLTGAAQAVAPLGLTLSAPRPMFRPLAGGGELRWSISFLEGHDEGPLLPFLIRWESGPHPADGAPPGCTLASFELRTPDPEAVERIVRALGLTVAVSHGDRGLIADLETPRGRLRIDSSGLHALHGRTAR